MGQQDNKQEGSHEEQQQSEHTESGRTGEGAASAMAHMNQDKRNRYQPGDSDNSSGAVKP